MGQINATSNGSAAISKSSVSRAGDVLRAVHVGLASQDEKYWTAYQTLVAYRSEHQYPLIKATSGLRSNVGAELCNIEVSQRLKRIPTILDKLQREPGMDLSRMQDFGGCRAVLNNVDEVRRVQERVLRTHKRRNGTDAKFKDYITTPRESGYRGVHVVVTYDGRLIEVQLRTKVMHEWAIAVERLSGRTGINLKSSDGPSELHEFFTHASILMALDEAGESVDADLISRMTALRETAVLYLSKGTRSKEGD